MCTNVLVQPHCKTLIAHLGHSSLEQGDTLKSMLPYHSITTHAHTHAHLSHPQPQNAIINLADSHENENRASNVEIRRSQT